MSWGFGEDSVGFSLFCSLVEVYSPFPQDDARSRVWLLTPNAPTGAAVFSVTHRHSSQVPRLPKPIVEKAKSGGARAKVFCFSEPCLDFAQNGADKPLRRNSRK